jgi:hypothetical protein
MDPGAENHPVALIFEMFKTVCAASGALGGWRKDIQTHGSNKPTHSGACCAGLVLQVVRTVRTDYLNRCLQLFRCDHRFELGEQPWWSCKDIRHDLGDLVVA